MCEAWGQRKLRRKWQQFKYCYFATAFLWTFQIEIAIRTWPITFLSLKTDLLMREIVVSSHTHTQFAKSSSSSSVWTTTRNDCSCVLLLKSVWSRGCLLEVWSPQKGFSWYHPDEARHSPSCCAQRRREAHFGSYLQKDQVFLENVIRDVLNLSHVVIKITEGRGVHIDAETLQTPLCQPSWTTTWNFILEK
jgi:hypothetical protein